MNTNRITWRGCVTCLLAWTTCSLSACDSADSSPPEVEPADPGIVDALALSLQQERLAHATYTQVISDLGEIAPFDQIVLAEAQHVEAVSGLFAKFGLEVPAGKPVPEEIPVFTTRTEACAAAAEAEQNDVALYDALLTLDLPGEVIHLFNQLRAASLEHHLPAFVICREGGTDAAALDPAVVLVPALQDEFRAQFTYARVLADLGEVKPFSTIVLAETRHVAAVTGLFTKRDLEVPASEWTPENVPTFATRAEACVSAALAEEANAALYDDLLSSDLPQDVVKVFESLRTASLEKHLPAFVQCAEGSDDPPGFDAIAVLGLALQDEFRAHFTYSRVLTDLGDIAPFNQIALAEAEHVAALSGLFTVRDLEVPESEWNQDNVPNYDTRAEACAAAALAEEANVGLYDDLLTFELPSDVTLVFNSLRAASLEHHLPAFVACAEGPGDPPEFDAYAVVGPALQDEFRMHFTYAKVLTELGDINPFRNIVLSEGQHVAAVADLLISRGLDVPASQWNDGNLPTFATRAEACSAAVIGEEANVALYDALLLDEELPRDVRTVFAALRTASSDSHRVAFEGCAGSG